LFLREVLVSFAVTCALMFVFWLLLSGHLDVFHIVNGIASSLLVAFFSHDLLVPPGSRLGRGLRKLVRFLAYLPWLLWQVVKANLEVAYVTLHPRLPIEPSVIRFDTRLREALGITTLANSITLTPGTVTIEATREGTFLVHTISRSAAQSLLAGEMPRRVERIERGDV
jgi:multicomponent Na+:H+ antiporter subunit E